ncbi:hypothetical protein JCM33374_g5098 [Metschnikowia sp. JCM 33374]|nr:hypothetical protein JCM33374_g5098 [Metschnikowia sp. JCM 33374]
MKLFTLSPYILVVSASKVIHEGVMFFHTLGNSPEPCRISTSGSKLVASDVSSTVRFYDTGEMFCKDKRQYLSFNTQGQLVLESYPDNGFTVEFIPTYDCADWTLGIRYKGENTFQLCSDDSFGLKSQCDVSREISLVLEPDWRYSGVKGYGSKSG